MALKQYIENDWKMGQIVFVQYRGGWVCGISDVPGVVFIDDACLTVVGGQPMIRLETGSFVKETGLLVGRHFKDTAEIQATVTPLLVRNQVTK